MSETILKCTTRHVRLFTARVENNDLISDPDHLCPESFHFEKGDALLSEIESFLSSVREGKKPKVTAQDGLNAIRVAWQIKSNLL